MRYLVTSNIWSEDDLDCGEPATPAGVEVTDSLREAIKWLTASPSTCDGTSLDASSHPINAMTWFSFSIKNYATGELIENSLHFVSTAASKRRVYNLLKGI